MRITRRQFLAASVVGVTAVAGGARYANALESVRTARPRRVGAPPLRIALLTDVHAPHSRVDEQDIVDRVCAFDPHLVLMGGDAIERPRHDHRLALYGRLPARSGRFAVFGNHERWGGFTPVSLGRAYERHGVRLLVNEGIEIDHEGEPIEIVGLDDWRTGAPNVELLREKRGPATTDRECPPAIVLSHCPILFDAIDRVAGKPTYVLSGHTHGGQVAPLGLALATPYGSGRYVRGWYDGGTAGRQMYVSRGIGWVGVPFRLGARPELSLITI